MTLVLHAGLPIVFGAYYLVALVVAVKDHSSVNLQDLHPFAPFRRHTKDG